MATAAQILANQANAQHSTGPKTEDGKARAAKNNIKHGLSFGILVLSQDEQDYIQQFEATMRHEMKPAGAIEETVFAQFLDAAARLHKIQGLITALARRHSEDPIVVPDAAAEWNQLTRYRAAAEMQLYSSVNTLMELQTTRLFRELHLVQVEQEYIPPMVNGSVKMWLGNSIANHNDRELLYAMQSGARPLYGRLPNLPARTQSPRNPPGN